MPVVMRMEWAEATPEQYEQVRQVVGWERDVPRGAVFHVAFFNDAGLNVVDVWETAEDFQAFTDERLMPGIAQIGGIEGEPTIRIDATQAIFNAGALARA